VPCPVEEDEPDEHAGDQGQRNLDDPVAQLTEMVHERHPALWVLLPLRTDVALADYASTLDGAGEFRHDGSRCEIG